MDGGGQSALAVFHTSAAGCFWQCDGAGRSRLSGDEGDLAHDLGPRGLAQMATALRPLQSGRPLAKGQSRRSS